MVGHIVMGVGELNGLRGGLVGVAFLSVVHT